MEEALETCGSKDTKERMAGVERLYHILEASRRSLSSSETTSMVDVILDLLKDNNFRVSQGALQALASAAVLSGDHLKIHFNAIVPAIVERLGDAKQPVRDASRRLLLTLMEVSSPTIIVERAGSYAWTHKSWRVREEFARTVTAAMDLFASTELTLQRAILPSILQMLNDSNHAVREAAILCIEEMYSQAGSQFRDELQRHHLPTSTVRDINARLEKIEPKIPSSEGSVGDFVTGGEVRPASHNTKKNSPKAKSSTREVSLFGGEGDATEKPIDSVKVYSEKELLREFEKITSTLVPDKDWSIRIAAMQRVEGLVFGGAADYPSFHGLLKRLVGPLCTQLSDRRSSIVKQACHLLNFLSTEFLGDFDACAELFIPVLFKLVVITVLVIAESADNCIKTMLRNCNVGRLLPRIADCAKNDRSAILRARCCEYALLILEYWADAPEIQRSADLYEELIKCCVGDAMSEVRSTARTCYRMFTKTWPERSRRLFSSFDPIIQRVINEEEGGLHRRHASPALRERISQLPFTSSQVTAHSSLPGYGASAIVAMDRNSNLAARSSLCSGLLLSQTKSLNKGSERSLESVLHSSKQKVTAIESMLRRLDVSDKQNRSTLLSSSIDLGVDSPSSRNPPFPLAAPASNNLRDESTTSGVAKGGLVLSDIITQIQASKDAGKILYRNNVSSETLPALSSYAARNVSERRQERAFVDETTGIREGRPFMNPHNDRHYLDTPYKDSNYRDSQNNYVPNFQRPLLRKPVTGRISTGRRKSFDDNQLSVGDMSSYVEGPASLGDALSEGLSSSSDWSARVAAFNYIRSLLQQGQKCVHEVTQNFEKVMKLFFQHLDDPHHKVAQAALSTLADIIASCRKPFESYMERILPHVFSRLIDPKELVRLPCSSTLEIVSKTYGTDSLLPALLRSLDEQRSPKAKLAVIDFAISSFKKPPVNPEGSSSGILKLWLTKLMPLVHNKNMKLKEAAITCIISIYSHFDSVSVLNFIISLSVEEQNFLRRSLKHYTPRIEVDLMNFLHNKKERRQKAYDPSDVGASTEDGYIGASKQSRYFVQYSTGSIDDDSGKKWSSAHESSPTACLIGHTNQTYLYENLDVGSSSDGLGSKTNGLNYSSNTISENIEVLNSPRKNEDSNIEALCTPHLDTNGLTSLTVTDGLRFDSEAPSGINSTPLEASSQANSISETKRSIPQILHLVCNSNDDMVKCHALQQLVEYFTDNDHSTQDKYFNQVLTVILEVLDDSDSLAQEHALSLIVEMLKNQKDAMEDSVEIIIEKLLYITKDIPKVSNEAELCLSIVLSQSDPFRCLNVIVPLLVSKDEKTLVTCVNSLTKLVGRLSQEELITQLPSFLPALFRAFGNQSADVRKTVVFCLVDMYIMLGKTLLPYLEEGLNSTQLRLVTIYANRISQARTSSTVDSNP